MAATAPTVPKAPLGERAPAVLLLIDVINHFEHPDGDKLLAQAAPIAPRLARLKQRARASGIPTIYVNDNFGDWRSNFPELLHHCLRSASPGCEFVRRLQPAREDYLILKPKHSAFYQTPLDTLLAHLQTETLILAGLSTTSCILCSAHDANMREYKLYVPSDCCAGCSAREHRQAIEQIGLIRNARVTPSRFLRLDSIAKGE